MVKIKKQKLIVAIAISCLVGIGLFFLIYALIPRTYRATLVGMYEDQVLYTETRESKEAQDEVFEWKTVEGFLFHGWEDGTFDYTIEVKSSYPERVVYAYYRRDYSTALPIINIVTDGMQEITSKETYLTCSVSVEDIHDPIEKASASVRCRGNGSYTIADKKSYRIKFDEKTPLLGTQAKKNYNLVANQFDRTLSRNSLAYELGEMLDGIDYSSTHRWVEVYINHTYNGLYLLCDQIQTGKGRVDIDDSIEELDTGYLIEMNMRIGENPYAYVRIYLDGVFYEMKSPEFDEMADAIDYQLYVFYYMQDCVNALKSGSWDEVTNLLDVDSFVDTYIIQELMGNIDVGRYSFYLYKEKSGKLFAGPVWDFDLSGGNAGSDMGNPENCPPDQKLYAKEKNYWYSLFMNRAEFISLVHDRLREQESLLRQTLSLVDPTNVNGYYGMYREDLERNYEKWTYDSLFPAEWQYENREVANIKTIEGQFDYLYRWLTKRLDYMLNVI